MIQFKIRAELITEADLLEFEGIIGLELPNDYKKHMLLYNGGSPINMDTYFGDYDGGIELFSFHPIKFGSNPIEKNHEDSKRYLPKNHFRLGYTHTGNLCMSLDKKTYGHIYVYYSDMELEFLASSFSEFIKGLQHIGDIEDY